MNRREFSEAVRAAEVTDWGFNIGSHRICGFKTKGDADTFLRKLRSKYEQDSLEPTSLQVRGTEILGLEGSWFKSEAAAHRALATLKEILGSVRASRRIARSVTTPGRWSV